MAEMVQKLKKADRTRRALLDAALRVIGQKGYSSATVDEIVREAGVSKGVAYYHFKSKEDMAVSILDQELSALSGKFEVLSREGGAPQEVLLSMLQVFATQLYERKDFAQFFSMEIWRGGRAWSDVVRASAQGLIDLVSAQLKRGQKQGVVRKELDPIFAAASIVGMVVVDAMYSLEGGGKPLFTCEEFVERIRDFAHHAVALR